MPKRDIFVIGASMGGIEVIKTILSMLPWDFTASIFVVVHTTEYSPGLLPQVLNRSSKVPVLYAVHDAPILPSRVYVAPGGQRHMLLDRGRIKLQVGPRENHHRPSIDVLFRSAAQVYGSEVVGVVLTGNLDDGSAGLAEIKVRRGLAIVQDPKEAMAPSMPLNAIENTDVDFILPAEEIGPKLVELSSQTAEPVISISTSKAEVPSGLTYACPECGGVLEEVEENKLQRYRCRVGHLYSLESLLADQTEAVERALWAAIRSMEEQAEFSGKLAENSRRKEHIQLARRFDEKAAFSRDNAAVIRALLRSTGDEVFEIPDERTGTE
jgi:two-component system, chemotaxis family, protein-glutamate methylesterase/glutaminase